MRPEAEKYLYDIRRALDLIENFTVGRTFADYEDDVLLRSGVERQFAIAGEALSQLSRIDAALASQISDYRRIIAFRNLLIHGYADIDDRIVWGVIERELPALRSEVAALFGD
jgi:uncharacterized protein with HEPN domain